MLWRKEQSQLEREVLRAEDELGNHPVTTDKYADVLTRVERLHKMQMQERSDRVSKETWATLGANLLGIAMIIKHEQLNVLTSRALALLPRFK